MIGGFGVPPFRLLEILLNAFAVLIEETEPILGDRVFARRTLAVPACSFLEILSGSFAAFEKISHPSCGASLSVQRKVFEHFVGLRLVARIIGSDGLNQVCASAGVTINKALNSPSGLSRLREKALNRLVVPWKCCSPRAPCRYFAALSLRRSPGVSFPVLSIPTSRWKERAAFTVRDPIMPSAFPLGSQTIKLGLNGANQLLSVELLSLQRFWALAASKRLRSFWSSWPVWLIPAERWKAFAAA